jgi:NADPH:quinone reductase-like Zn-dependent oxidoreductase
MRAMVLPRVGSYEDLVEATVPTPVPGAGEVLVRVHTVAANHQDHFVCRGRGNVRSLQLPHIVGNDPAGEVVAVAPGVDTSRIGGRVLVKPAIACDGCDPCLEGHDDACERLESIGVHRAGGLAEYVAVPAQNAFPIPSGVDFATATALAQSFPVALNMLERAELAADDVVFVTGAAGAIGSACIQLARHAGARVIAGASSPERVAYAEALGAELGIDYRAEPEFSATIRDVFPAGVSLYIETAGDPDTWREALRALGRRSRVAVCGSHAGPLVTLDLNWLFRMRVTVMGSAGSTRRGFAHVLELAGDGRVSANIDSILPLAKAKEAFRRLENRENRGKLVLQVAP